MNIIIIGAGEVGRHLATSLSREAHSITVIESNPELAAELEQSLDARIICEDGTSVTTLLEAGVSECDLFLALTSDNTINVMAASVAKKLDAKKVISRVHPEVQREEWLFDYRSHFGIDHIFSSERLSAIELAKFIRNPESLVVEEIARGRIELQQVRVSDKSDVPGKKLIDLKAPEELVWHRSLAVVKALCRQPIQLLKSVMWLPFLVSLGNYGHWQTDCKRGT